MQIMWLSMHSCSLPDDKILHWSKFEQIADDILNSFEK